MTSSPSPLPLEDDTRSNFCTRNRPTSTFLDEAINLCFSAADDADAAAVVVADSHSLVSDNDCGCSRNAPDNNSNHKADATEAAGLRCEDEPHLAELLTEEAKAKAKAKAESLCAFVNQSDAGDDPFCQTDTLTFASKISGIAEERIEENCEESRFNVDQTAAAAAAADKSGGGVGGGGGEDMKPDIIKENTATKGISYKNDAISFNDNGNMISAMGDGVQYLSSSSSSSGLRFFPDDNQESTEVETNGYDDPAAVTSAESTPIRINDDIDDVRDADAVDECDAVAMDTLCITESCDTDDENPKTNEDNDRRSRVFSTDVDVDMMTSPTESDGNADGRHFEVLQNEGIGSQSYQNTDLFISDYETTPCEPPPQPSPLMPSRNVPCSNDDNVMLKLRTMSASASKESVRDSRSTRIHETRPLLKVSSAFIDLSGIQRHQQPTGRDRARSESGKDSAMVLVNILSNKADLPPKKTTAKRVDSIRKSLIKFGTFGKDHINGKGKSKKERDKNKTESADHPQLKRSGSERISGPFSLPLPGLQSQKSPEARFSTRIVTSPLLSCQTDISHPQAVEDPEKLEQFSKQRLTTVRKMYEQACLECEGLKQEYQKKPTEVIHSNLEAKVKVVKRLQTQLSMYGGDSDAPSGEKGYCARRSSLECSLPIADADRETTARPPRLPPYYVPRHKNSDAGVPKANSEKQDVSLSRSHSDSYKRIKQNFEGAHRFTASTDEIPKITAATSGEFSLRHGSDSCSRSKSQEVASDDSSDPVLNQSAAACEHPPLTPGSANHDAVEGLKQHSDIIALDDYEFESDEENAAQFEEFGSPFNDFSILENRPAHLAVFLHYLISNSDASPLLFYLMSGHSYGIGSNKELRKWGYEIFSTFLVDKAPLKVKVDDVYLESIHDTMLNKFDKEEVMRSLFSAVREKAVLPQIKDLLSDFCSKRALGLGGIYGDHELKDGLDHAAELKVVDSVLWKHFERAAVDDCERNQVLASALATYFKQVGCSNSRNSSLIERCPTFNTKDKTKFSMFGKSGRKERGFSHRGHQLFPQHYYTITNCIYCQSVLFGVGNQGYQCQKCDQNFHKSCLEKIKDSCTGKRSSKSSTVFDKFMSKKTTGNPSDDGKSTFSSFFIRLEEPNEDDLALGVGLETLRERTMSMPCVRDVAGKSSTLSYKPSFAALNFWDKARGHKDSFSSKVSDKGETPKVIDEAKAPILADTMSSETAPHEEHRNDPAELTKSPPSYTSSIVFSAPPYSSVPPDGLPPSYSSINMDNDPDLEVEQDLPPLEAVIPKEYLRKLDKKEKSTDCDSALIPLPCVHG